MQTLTVTREASYTLNFLVYIQNVYLNQENSTETARFPYMPITYSFRDDFERQYAVLWQELVGRIQQHPANDTGIFAEEQEMFYSRLFEDDNQNWSDYTALYRSYRSWWESLAGHFSLERALDDKAEKVYSALAEWIKAEGLELKKKLTMSVLYDENLLGGTSPSAYFVTVPLRLFYVDDADLLVKLQVSVYEDEQRIIAL
ncbi:hypothetical protein [Planococcus lenghuensis]|uniref:Uncharacterized protein n=1 Tax=Planococcus lenghuensis TaxID=2213202 RepID=A0A1Q2KY63_9BACL|nr:hypothetical protein [Planococcus lenghuensis]AQQ53150.1 hypothetical protein B0X71_08630 [Planococcus lenghuensis]